MEEEIKDSGLYFVHEFYDEPINNETDYVRMDGNRERNRVILFQDRLDDLDTFRAYNIPRAFISNGDQMITEGDFLSYDGERFTRADNDPAAIMYQEITRRLTRHLLRANRGRKPRTVGGEIRSAFSYHINVGHGNCSVILFNESGNWKMWMVDCSSYDYTNHKNNYHNIQQCLTDINIKYHIKTISKLLITHLHFDHINAVGKLIEDGYINKDTEVWINLKYPWSQPTYSRILSYLSALNVPIIDPIVSNSIGQIKILYPSVSYNKTHIPPKRKINNASVVYQINLINKKMLFPGDLETDGWDKLSCCFPNLNGSNYYCISHHGSLNGHLRNLCPRGKMIGSLADCSCSDIQILMGRNNAYSGIYSPKVLCDFKKIQKVEDTSNYIMIDWSNDSVVKNKDLSL